MLSKKPSKGYRNPTGWRRVNHSFSNNLLGVVRRVHRLRNHILSEVPRFRLCILQASVVPDGATCRIPQRCPYRSIGLARHRLTFTHVFVDAIVEKVVKPRLSSCLELGTLRLVWVASTDYCIYLFSNKRDPTCASIS